MKYYITFRPYAHHKYKYDRKYLDYEKTNPNRLESVIDLPITVEHRKDKNAPPLIIGKVIKEWVSKDGCKKALAEIDGSTTYGRCAIEECKRGLIKGVSPIYDLSCWGTPFGITHSERKFKNFAMTQKPSFDGPNGTEIFAGWSENDLNINLNNDKQLEDLTFESIKSLMATPAAPAPVAEQQTPQTATQPAQPAQGQQQQPEIATQQKFPPNANAIAQEILKTPEAIEKLSPEELKYALKTVAAANAQQTSQVVPTTQQLVNEVKQNIQQQQQQPEQSETYKAAQELFRDRIESIVNAFTGINDKIKVGGKQAADPTKGVETIRKWGDPIINNPLSREAAAAMPVMQLFERTMVHAAELHHEVSNQTNRDQLKQIEVDQAVNNIRRNFGDGYGPMSQKQPDRPAPYPQKTAPLDQAPKDWEERMQRNIMAKMSAGGYTYQGVTTYDPHPQQQQQYQQQQYQQYGGAPQYTQ